MKAKPLNLNNIKPDVMCCRNSVWFDIADHNVILDFASVDVLFKYSCLVCSGGP